MPEGSKVLRQRDAAVKAAIVCLRARSSRAVGGCDRPRRFLTLVVDRWARKAIARANDPRNSDFVERIAANSFWWFIPSYFGSSVATPRRRDTVCETKLFVGPWSSIRKPSVSARTAKKLRRAVGRCRPARKTLKPATEAMLVMWPSLLFADDRKHCGQPKYERP